MRPYCYYIFLFFICLPPCLVHAQSFPGLSHDKNTISEIFTNPGYALNDDAFQVNVFGVSFLAANNGYAIRKKDIFSGADPEGGTNYFKLPGEFSRSAWVNLDMIGPAVSFKIKKKYSFAISTRARFMANVDNLSKDLFQLIDNKSSDTNFIYKINNLSLTTQVFSEVNLMYSGYVYQSEDYNVVAGIGFKILSGIGAAGLGIPNGQFQIGEDNIARHIKGSINVAFTPYANTWLSSAKPLDALDNAANNRGYGLDIGAIYSYTPATGVHFNHEGYTFRLAASVTDIGSINYYASSTTGSYKGNSDNFNQNNIDRDPTHTYGQIINQYMVDSVITQTASKTKFKMGLPTALRLNADMKVGSSAHYNSYININLVLNLRKPSADNFSTHYVSTCTITPRMLWRSFGVGIPFSFNANKQGFLGVVMYAGPFYIGTSSLANFLILKNMYSADGFAGLSFRIPGKKKELY